jgi:hypothetical protein
MARSIGAGVRGGSTAMVATCSGLAPCRRSSSKIESSASRVRGTRTRQPYSARDSHHDSDGRVDTPAPMVTTSGPVRSRPSADSVARVASTVRWLGRLVPAVMVAGVSGASPCSTRFAAVSARWPAAACNSRVPGAPARLCQSDPVLDRTSALVCDDPRATPE